MRRLSLFLLCFIGGSPLAWSHGHTDDEPVDPPGLTQNLAPPTAPGASTNDASLAGLSSSAPTFLHGYRAFQDKNWEAARAAFEHVQQHVPLLADYGSYFLGEVHIKAGRPAEAHAVLERLLDEYPTSVWRSDAALTLAQLAFAEARWKRARAYAEQAQQNPLATDATRHQCALLIAQADEQQGRRSLAYQGYQALRASAPRAAVGNTAKARVARLREQYPADFSLRTARAHYDEARLLLKEEDVETARRLAEQFQTRFSTSSLRPAGLFILAGIYASQGQRAAALAGWREIAERYPDTAFAPRALYRWARFFWNQDEDEAALPLFKRLTTAYPDHDLAAESWYAMGRIFQSKQDHASAASAYGHLRRHFPRSPVAREAHWRQGWMAYSQRDYPSAQAVFQNLSRSRPGTAEAQRALYWQARVAGRLGQSEEAANLYRRLLRRYPHGYYALWAEKRLGITLSMLPGKPPPAPPTPRLSAVQTPHYRRYTALADLGLLGLARRELDFIRHRAPGEKAWTQFLLSAYRSVHDYTAVFRLLPRLNAREADRQAYLYPRAYWNLILPHAKKNGLDPSLVIALIRQESLFDATAVSSANAHGLMQILPTTAARLTALPSGAGSALTDPALNIRLGTKYLRLLLERYEGSLILALGAYNAGEQAADKWLTHFGRLDPDEFVEHISYGETRRYVKLVLRNYRIYVRMYGNGARVAEIRLP